jgi:3-phosphoshikimate 1-carboxyvinyltransferase
MARCTRRPEPAGASQGNKTALSESPDSPAGLAIEPRGPLDVTVRVPGSKSITNRALVCAALANGETHISSALDSEDTQMMRGALTALGTTIDSRHDPWVVSGGRGLISPSQPLHTANSGTTARFLTAIATLADGPVIVDGGTRMRERPINDLVDALILLGARARVEGENGCPPVWLEGGGLDGGEIEIDASLSSQFVSAVMLAAPYAREDVTLYFVDNVLVSRPYVDLTIDVMKSFGAEAAWVDAPGPEAVRVRAGTHYQPRRYTVEPDASAATYPFCAAAIAGGKVRIHGIPEVSHQSDFGILGLLERMGCKVSREGRSVTVEGPSDGLKSLGEVDMNHMSDAALTYAVLCLFANGPTTITNVAHVRLKETDRLLALETELRRLGARAEATESSLKIQPGPLHGAEIETYNDHRMAMAFSLAGLRVPGVVIKDPDCVVKTWPNYFEVLRHL